MASEIKQQTAKPDFRKFDARLKALFPELDVDFMVGFGSTMLMLHTFMVLTESYFQSLGTSKGRFLILVRLLISDSPVGESISSLRPFYPISYAAMSGVLDTLEKDGMIERLSHPSDRRKVNIRITEAGRAFMMDFVPKHLENIKALSSLLTEEDRVMLPEIVQKLIRGFEGFLARGEGQSGHTL